MIRATGELQLRYDNVSLLSFKLILSRLSSRHAIFSTLDFIALDMTARVTVYVKSYRKEGLVAFVGQNCCWHMDTSDLVFFK
jgi:hypothetical protein